MNKELILCVDDENIVLDSLKEQLQNEFGDEHIIEIAESGEEALEIVEESLEDGYEIPVVIADFIMPHMKGDELLSRIHEQLKGTKSIMLTGQASIEGVSNAVNKANLFRYISKPWDKDDLILTIKEAIKSYRQEKIIATQNKELLELNSTLEKKVKQRTIELEDLNRTKDKFFSIIAHDLKNPFNTLLGFSELMLENMDRFKPEQIREYIQIIFDTSRSSYSLLENLLDWSRTQTGAIKINKEEFDLQKLAAENVTLLTNPAVQKGIDLIDNILPGTMVYADRNMINTVIRNLISNAVKYTSEKGKITIDCAKKGDKLQVSISDTGVGIKPQSLKNIFRIDVNLSTKGTANEKGTGLGLVLCKEFVAKNGGDVSVESESGKGSTFYFTLPLNQN